MGHKLVFETKTCPRCGGSGQYSYCEMWGTTCFGCSGRKWVLTKAGASAASAYEAFMLERFGRAVTDLRDGDRIRVDGRWKTVRTITRPDGTGGYCSTRVADGTETRRYYTTLHFAKSDHGVFEDTRFTVWTPELWPAVLAWAERRKGVTYMATEEVRQ